MDFCIMFVNKCIHVIFPIHTTLQWSKDNVNKIKIKDQSNTILEGKLSVGVQVFESLRGQVGLCRRN